MKLLIITSLKEYQKTVAHIADGAGIDVFSITEIMGFKDRKPMNLLDNWFSSGDEHFNSILFFSFTTEEKANRALELVRNHNSNDETGFPLRAFILPVEQSSH